MRIGNTIYLDHQSNAPLDARVFAKMNPYLVSSFGNPHSTEHFLGWRAGRALEDAAAKIAGLVGADPDEIIFTSGATESNNLALLGVGRRATGGKRRRILVSEIEHKCVLAACRTLHESLGYQVEVIPVDSEGRIHISALEELIKDDVLLVSIMAANNEIGTIQDISAIYKIVRSHDAIFHCDAAQAPCAMDLSGIAEQVDLLSLSSHKMYGPMGVGALYIQRRLQERVEPLVYGGGQQQNLRSGTVPVALCVGMGAAAELFCSPDAANEREAVRFRRDRFVDQLRQLPWAIEENGPKGAYRHPGNANVRFSGFAAQEILGALQPHVAASTGSACSSGIPEPSHVLRAIGLAGNDADASIRFSLGRGTTDKDVQEAVGYISGVLTRLEPTSPYIDRELPPIFGQQ